MSVEEITTGQGFLQSELNHYKNWPWDFSGGAVVKNPPASAGDMGSSPGLGKSHTPRATKPMCHNYWAHVPQLLKPAHLEPMLRNKRSHCNEKSRHCNEE